MVRGKEERNEERDTRQTDSEGTAEENETPE